MTTVSLSESDNQQHIEISPDDIIHITLDESPTTGFKWEIKDLDTSNLQLMSEDFHLNTESGIGGGGKKVIELKVLKKASGHLLLENRQPWTGDVYKKFEFSYS